MKNGLWTALLAVACSGAPAMNPPPDATPDAPPADAAAPDATAPDAAAPDAAPEDAPAARSLRWESQLLGSAGPFGRWGYMVANVGDGTAFLYGGTTLDGGGRGAVSSELWRYDGRGEAPTFARVTASGEPPARYCGCVGWLADSRTLLMVGGRNPAEAAAETWAFDTASGAWSRVAAPETPGGVIGCAMAWSTARGALYLFGGGGERVGFSSRTWRYDPAAPRWVQLDATGPRGRYDDAFVPMPDGRRVVMVAGARGAQAGAGFYNDVWMFDAMAESWEQVTVEGEAPPGRRNPWVSVDADGQGLVMAMGSTGIQPGQVLDDLWRLDLRARRWTNLDPAEAPPARGFITALPGAGAVRGYLLGGYDNVRPVRDLWRLREE